MTLFNVPASFESLQEAMKNKSCLVTLSFFKKKKNTYLEEIIIVDKIKVLDFVNKMTKIVHIKGLH